MDEILIKRIVSEALINEGFSEVLYHFTTIQSLYNILRTNSIRLSSTFSTPNGADDYSHGNKIYYLSCTRQSNGSLGFSHNRDVRIELDGRLLSYRYSGKAIDYWGSSGGKSHYYDTESNGKRREIDYKQPFTENEDRIVSNEPFIYDISNYVKHIDIFLPSKDYDFNSYDISVACLAYFKYSFDKVTIYGDRESFDNRISKNNINNYIKEVGYSYLSQNNNNFPEVTKDNVRLGKSIANVIRYILFGETTQKDFYKKVNELISSYSLEPYRSVINKRLQNVNDFYLSTVTLADLCNDLSNDIQSIQQSNDNILYNQVMKMLTDYCNPKGITNTRKAYAYKADLINSIASNGRKNYDYDKINNDVSLTYIKIGRYLIVDLNKTNIWDILPDYMKDEFISVVYNHFLSYDNDIQHKSKSDEHFYKYLQHLTKNFFSVRDYLNFLKKWNFSEDDKEALLNYNEVTEESVGKWDFENPFRFKYLNPSDEEKVYQALVQKTKIYS